jgi:formylglycine-generating enzyme required for sulfatase activity
VLKAAQSLFLSDSHPAVHSAADLLIKRWGGIMPSTSGTQSSTEQPESPNQPRWMAGANGHTLAIVIGPTVFQMGSPESEEGRFPWERLHARRIDRSIAVSTKEVTIEQYRAFDPSRGPDARYTHTVKCPINNVTWYDAARYCNWLSAQEGIPKKEWCFPESVDETVLLDRSSVERAGYRLPTEAEWEYLCRAGTVTARPFGDSPDLFPRYGWTWLNSLDRVQPAGELLPNPLGLFDMLGNVWEWCQDGNEAGDPDQPAPYPTGTSRENSAHDHFAGGAVSKKAQRMIRGGAFDYSPAQARSAHRYLASPGFTEATYGFRVIRTLPQSRDR